MAALFILAGALVGAIVSWLALRRQLVRTAAAWLADNESLRAEVNRISSEWRERDLAGVKSAPVLNGFNMNRRPEAVRRLHAGMAIDRVSSGTGWSIPEIALLQKIEKLR